MLKQFLSKILLLALLGFFISSSSSASRSFFKLKQQMLSDQPIHSDRQIDFDDIILNVIQSNISPFVTEKLAKKNPYYKYLEDLALELRSVIVWTSSVSASVSELPFHPERYVFDANEEFNGWFDELSRPNFIFIHKEATLTILIHELRHALHLGTLHNKMGNKYDQLLIQSKRELSVSKEKFQNLGLSLIQIKNLTHKAYRMIECFSEIMAHQGDYILAEAFNDESKEAQIDFIKEYYKEFQENFVGIQKILGTKKLPMIRKLNQSLEQYLREKKLKL